MTPLYAPLMEKPADDGSVRLYLLPENLIKFVKRVRKVTLFIRIQGELISEFDDTGDASRVYQLGGNIKVPAREVIKLAEDWKRFNERKSERGDNIGYIETTRMGDCIFIG